MNYLSHFQLNEARGDGLDPVAWFTTGVMVPDLWPRHSRTPRLRAAPIDPARLRAVRIDPARLRAAAPTSAPERALRAGLLEHVAADDAFHGCAAFRRWRRALIPAAEALLERRSLASFLTHVGIELVLDRVVLSEDPGVGPAYYARLDAVDPARLEVALVSLVGGAAANFGRLFEGFRVRRHLLDYVDLPAVALSLEHIFTLLDRGSPPPRAELLSFLEATEEVLRGGEDPPSAPERWVSIAS